MRLLPQRLVEPESPFEGPGLYTFHVLDPADGTPAHEACFRADNRAQAEAWCRRWKTLAWDGIELEHRLVDGPLPS